MILNVCLTATEFIDTHTQSITIVYLLTKNFSVTIPGTGSISSRSHATTRPELVTNLVAT